MGKERVSEPKELVEESSEDESIDEEELVQEYLKAQEQIDTLKKNGTIAWLNSVVSIAFQCVQLIGWCALSTFWLN